MQARGWPGAKNHTGIYGKNYVPVTVSVGTLGSWVGSLLTVEARALSGKPFKTRK